MLTNLIIDVTILVNLVCIYIDIDIDIHVINPSNNESLLSKHRGIIGNRIPNFGICRKRWRLNHKRE
jgi:hypothetical protein